MPKKKPFDLTEAISLLRVAVAPHPKAALFELHADGFTSVFHILVACVLSIRPYDEVSLPAARRLFATAPTPEAVAALNESQIDALITPCTFHPAKAKTVRAIAQQTVSEYGGELPADPEALMAFHGVGPKCANLAVGIAAALPLIGVDVHVHRVTNRWGLVATTTPEKTMAALMSVLPQSLWVEINALLVPFGKHVCTGAKPKCSTCPLLAICKQVGVVEHR